MTVLVFKSPKRVAYKQQNLRILSGRNGTQVDTAYRWRWLPPGIEDAVADLQGRRALLVLCNEPFKAFFPAREAFISSVRADESQVRLTFDLGYFVEGHDADFGKVLLEHHSLGVPPARFILDEALDFGLETCQSPAGELDAQPPRAHAILR